MTPRQADLIRRSFDAIWPVRRKIASRFYRRFLNSLPTPSAIFCTVLSEKADLTLKRFEIRHDIHYLTRRELKSRHRRMNSLKQRSLQVCNWISET